jgi:hypothetical protein
MNILSTIWVIIQLIFKLFKKEPESIDQKRLELDIQLKECIKRGDSECVAKIREMLRHYKDLIK